MIQKLSSQPVQAERQRLATELDGLLKFTSAHILQRADFERLQWLTGGESPLVARIKPLLSAGEVCCL